MGKVEKEETDLFELTRKHIKKEKEIFAYLNGPKPINEKILNDLISKNIQLEDEICELYKEFFRSIQIQDHSVREQLIKIRDKKSATCELFTKSLVIDLTTDKKRSDEEAIGKIKKLFEEKEKEDLDKQDDTLQDMTDYIMDQAGWSVSFDKRKKDFGTIFIEKPKAPNMDVFLNYLKHFYLLNMHEAVIGFSRILLEIAFQWIYDKLPEKDKIKIVDFYRRTPPFTLIIEKACQNRLKSLGKNEKNIEDFVEKAVSKYKEASDILHGKLPKLNNEEESLEFIKDVFFIIETLYLERKTV